MKRKCFLILTFLVLAIILSGCTGGTITPLTDEAKIESVIQEYHLALNSQNWSKAKSCCVYGSDTYYDTCDIEDLVNILSLYCNSININVYADIQYISIYGNYSQVYCYGSIIISACGDYDSDSGYYYYDLQKIGNTWKIL